MAGGNVIEKLTGNELKKILAENGFGFSKSLGQNFLADERILNLIADDALITPEQTVLEIGTGAGTLTRVLSKRAKKVVSVEIESENPKVCRVTVPDAQLSLAIGNKGQNARLAAKLTGWKIDIRPESGFYGEDTED